MYLEGGGGRLPAGWASQGAGGSCSADLLKGGGSSYKGPDENGGGEAELPTGIEEVLVGVNGGEEVL